MIVLALVVALIPVVLGAYSLGKRGRPGVPALAILLFSLSAWGLAHALGFVITGPTSLYLIEQTALLLAAPLWLIFTVQHTGRGAWLRWPVLALIASVPLVTLALILTSRGLGAGTWFWIDVTYRIAAVSLGSALLLQQVLAGRNLYALQSSCLLGGFLAPWGLGTYQLFERASSPLQVSLAFIVTGLLFALGIYQWQLLDLSPISPEMMISSMNAGVLVLDLRNRVVDLNASAGRILGCDARQTVGKDFRKVISGSRIAPLEGDRGSVLLRNYERDGEAREEIVLGTREGSRYYDVNLSGLKGAWGRIGHLMVLHEVTERRLTAEQLGRKASYDSLTGLPNRSFFYERLGEEISRGQRRKSTLALFFIDLDRFKEVNDALGHEPVAQETGVIFRVEEWVLQEACKQMLSWQAREPEGQSLKMTVNLSSRHLDHSDLVGSVVRILRETALPPQNLMLDLGESALTESTSSENTLQALKDLGVGLTVDNFGAGYSSLANLRRFPLDTLKIDRSVVSELHSAPEMRKVLPAVVSLGHALGLTVSASGVETAQQLMHLRKMGCDTAQGHYFTEALSAKSASTFLASANLY